MTRLLIMEAMGFALVVVGILARAYMNMVVGRSCLAGTRESTEARYRRLAREHGAAPWPFVVTVTCIPLGMLICFGAILWYNVTTPE